MPLSTTAAPELLSPAGDRECLAAAIANGADAVYFGLDTGFNARARATSFHVHDLPEVMRLIHRHGLRGYATLNTLVFDGELPAFKEVVRAVDGAGVDAVLVQDVGAAIVIRKIAPGLTLHASTQMTLTSAETIGLAERLGMERVVVARELSIEEIIAIRRETAMPLEVFVHGALCVAYSGQCLTSESFGGRSANRGQCAQACRLPYELVCDGADVDLGDQRYLLSPQDLAAYALSPELIAAGVSAFKIEGRLKTPEYVAAITSHYRRAIDTAMAGQPVAFSPREVEEMELTFSRGFSPGWLHGNDHKQLVPATSSAKRGVWLGTVVAGGRGRVTVELAAGLGCGVKRGDGVAFDCGETSDDALGGRVYEVFVEGVSRTDAVTRGRVALAFAHDGLDVMALQPGQAVWKTDDPVVSSRLRKTFSGELRRQQPVDLEVVATPGEPVRVTATLVSGARVNVQSAEPAQVATRHPLDEATLRDQLGRLGRTPFELRNLVATITGGPMLPLSLLGRLRKELVAALEAAAEAPPPRPSGDETATAGVPSLSVRGDGVRVPEAVRVPGINAAAQAPSPGLRPASPRGRGGSEINRRAAGGPVDVHGEINRRAAGVSPLFPLSLPESSASENNPTLPQLHVLVRTLDQLEAVLALGERFVAADFSDIRLYRDAVAACRRHSATISLAPPRIQKPGEVGIFTAIEKHQPDGVLIRNWSGLVYFRDRGMPVVGDATLNVANHVSAGFFIDAGCTRVTASYDLNRDQLQALVAAVLPAWLEVVIHQHMPLFHMEHCVFCSVLSPGTDKTNCGRPCDDHRVELRDRVGMEHPLTADVGCRNTLWNATPQSGAEAVPAMLVAGVRHFRIEFLSEAADEVARVVRAYRELLAGRATGLDVWKQLGAANRVGVTRGTLEIRRDPLAIV